MNAHRQKRNLPVSKNYKHVDCIKKKGLRLYLWRAMNRNYQAEKAGVIKKRIEVNQRVSVCKKRDGKPHPGKKKRRDCNAKAETAPDEALIMISVKTVCYVKS